MSEKEAVGLTFVEMVEDKDDNEDNQRHEESTGRDDNKDSGPVSINDVGIKDSYRKFVVAYQVIVEVFYDVLYIFFQ